MDQHKPAILTREVEEVLSRLHSIITEEDLSALAERGYGSLEYIRTVKAEFTDLVKLALGGQPMSKEAIEKINHASRRSRPLFFELERRWTYETDGPTIDLAFPMLGQNWASGRMKECEYDECRRIYVPPGRGGRPSKYCSNICFDRAVRLPYQRAHRKGEK